MVDGTPIHSIQEIRRRLLVLAGDCVKIRPGMSESEAKRLQVKIGEQIAEIEDTDLLELESLIKKV